MASDVCEGDATEPLADDDMWDSGMPVLDLILEAEEPEDGHIADMPELMPSSLLDSYVSLHRVIPGQLNESLTISAKNFNEVTSCQEIEDISGNDPHLHPFKQDQKSEGTTKHFQQDRARRQAKQLSPISHNKGTRFAVLQKWKQVTLQEEALTGEMRGVQVVITKLPCFMCDTCNIWFSREQDLDKHDQEHHHQQKEKKDGHLKSSDNWLEKGFDSNNNDVIVQDGDGNLHLPVKRKNRRRKIPEDKLFFSKSAKELHEEGNAGNEAVAEECLQLDYLETKSNLTNISKKVKLNPERSTVSHDVKDTCCSHDEFKDQDNVKGQSKTISLDSVKSNSKVKRKGRVKCQGKVKVQSKVNNQDKSSTEGRAQIQHQDKVKSQVDKKVAKTTDGTEDANDVGVKRKNLKADVSKVPKRTRNSFHAKSQELVCKDDDKINSKDSIDESHEKKQQCEICQGNCTCESDSLHSSKMVELNRESCTVSCDVNDKCCSHDEFKDQDNVKGQNKTISLDSVKSNKDKVKQKGKIKGQGKVKDKSKVNSQDKSSTEGGAHIQDQDKVKSQVDKKVAKTTDGTEDANDAAVKRKKLKADVSKDPNPKRTRNSFHTKSQELVCKDDDKINSKDSIDESHEKKQQCEICQGNCTCESGNLHIISKSPQSKLKSLKSFNCTMCPVQFTRKSALLSHLKRHDGMSEGYKCEFCRKDFLTDSELDIHQACQHIDKLPYKCEFCAKTFVQQKAFKSHISKTHVMDKSYLCALCGAKFCNAVQLSKHRKVHAIKDLPYLCQHCPQQFPELKDLKKHMMGPKHKNVKEEDWGLEQCYVHKHLTKLKHVQKIKKKAIPKTEMGEPFVII
ncbi:uncharacterized protein [Amphiura filiformis]|uniref:uncharacterized protein n=1 Tax=Amphiura filiformis TaxID=82378 RepID=UPI003B217D37